MIMVRANGTDSNPHSDERRDPEVSSSVKQIIGLLIPQNDYFFRRGVIPFEGVTQAVRLPSRRHN